MADDDTTGTEVEETAETEDTTTKAGDQADDDKGSKAEWTPPTEAEWKAAQEKLKKANGQAAAHRKAAEEAARKGETESQTAVREASEAASKAAESTWKPRYVKQAARAALVTAGLTGAPDRLLKLIDADTVEIDDDGEVSGLDEQIRALKKDYPELFARRGSGRIDGADRGAEGTGNSKGWSSTSRKLLEQAS